MVPEIDPRPESPLESIRRYCGLTCDSYELTSGDVAIEPLLAAAGIAESVALRVWCLRFTAKGVAAIYQDGSVLFKPWDRVLSP